MPWWGWLAIGGCALFGLWLAAMACLAEANKPTLTPDEIAALFSPDEPL